MTKKQMLSKLVEPAVWESFYETYGLSIAEPTKKQLKFVELISEKIYESFGYKLSQQELKKLVGEMIEDDLSPRNNQAI